MGVVSFVWHGEDSQDIALADIEELVEFGLLLTDEAVVVSYHLQELG